jgi:hypothetical protein
VRVLTLVVAAAGLLVVSASGASTGAVPSRLQLLGHVDPADGYNGDVWGHRAFAYLSSWRGGTCPALGVRVYSLRNTRAPKHISTFADSASEPSLARTWTEKTIVRHIATPSFVGELAVSSIQACQQGAFQGFGLFDVTHPARPRTLALVRTDPAGSHEIWLQPKGRHAYVYTAIPFSELNSSPDGGQNPGQADFRIYDVTDPTRPAEVGEWGAWRALGIRPDAGPRRNFAHSVITNATATRAYLSYWDLGTVILDISRPAKPRYLGRTMPDQGSAHSSAVSADGRILIETHETLGGHPTIWNITNPRRPRRLAVFDLPVRSALPANAPSSSTGVHDPKLLSKRAYFSWYQRGVAVADISRPAHPRLLAQFVPPSTFDVDGSLCEEDCTMVWGVYPTAKYVLASDMLSGLWVLRLR